jgi:hypothetical protein
MTKIGDDAVKKATGKEWSEWFRILDRVKANTKSHREIVDILYKKHGIGPWWSQMVTVTYEQQRGMRALHEKADGFAASVSRTISAPIDELYTAWDDATRRATCASCHPEPRRRRGIPCARTERIPRFARDDSHPKVRSARRRPSGATPSSD